MSGCFRLTAAQMELLRPCVPKSRRKPRLDERRGLRGKIHVKKIGLRWKDAPLDYGPIKTLHNRFVRCFHMGVFASMGVELVRPGPDGDMGVIDSTHPKAHRTAASLSKKGS